MSAFADGSSLAGRWKADCLPVGGGFYERGVLDYNGETKIENIVESYYTDAKCKVPYANEVAVATFVVQDQTQDPTLKNLDVTFYQFFEAFLTAELVAKANEKKFCDYDNWELGRYKDITGRCNHPVAGTTIYNLVRVSEDKLFHAKFDADHTGKTPETRPAVLDIEAVWVREAEVK